MFHQREPGPWALERHLVRLQSILKPQEIFRDLQALLLKVIIKRPMVSVPPIPGNLDCRAKPFHSELYFNMEAMRQQPDLWDSFGLLQWYHLERLMTPREFFYPRVVIDFYQSMTT